MRYLLILLAFACASGCTPYGAWDLIRDLDGPAPDIAALSRDDLIQPENWDLVQEYLNEQVALGVSGPPTTDTATIAGLPGTDDWYGGVLAPNGKIYAMPRLSTSVLIIDPKSIGSCPADLAESSYLNRY